MGTAAAAFGIAAVQHTVDAGQAAYEMSAKFGILPGVASQWMAVASQMGLSADTIGNGFKFLDKNIGAMAITLQAHGKLTATTTAAYRDLGLSVFDSSGKLKSSNELMLEAADKFSKLAPGAEKTALAVKLFGRSGAEMLPILDQGRAGIEKLIASGQAMGDVMSGPQVEAAHKLSLEQDALKTAMAGVTMQVGEFLMPIATKFFGFLVSTGIPAIQSLGTWFMDHLWPAMQQVWAAAMQGYAVLKDFLTPMFDYIGAHIGNLKPVLIAVGILFAVVLGAVVVAVIAVVIIVTALVAAITWFAGKTEEDLGKVHGQWDALVNFVKALPGRITSAASGMWDGIWNAFRAMLNMIVHAWDSLSFHVPSILGSPAIDIKLPNIPSFQTGGTLPYTGLFYGHQGETVTPAGQAGGSGAPIVIHNYLVLNGHQIDLLTNTILQRARFAPGV